MINVRMAAMKAYRVPEVQTSKGERRHAGDEYHRMVTLVEMNRLLKSQRSTGNPLRPAEQFHVVRDDRRTGHPFGDGRQDVRAAA